MIGVINYKKTHKAINQKPIHYSSYKFIKKYPETTYLYKNCFINIIKILKLWRLK